MADAKAVEVKAPETASAQQVSKEPAEESQEMQKSPEQTVQKAKVADAVIQDTPETQASLKRKQAKKKVVI